MQTGPLRVIPRQGSVLGSFAGREPLDHVHEHPHLKKLLAGVRPCVREVSQDRLLQLVRVIHSHSASFEEGSRATV